MLEVIPALDSWAADSPDVGMAVVVRTSGSTPRAPGARLAATPDGRMAGSVSGGCLEADVVEQMMRTLEGTEPSRLLHYGIADELGWTVGLACGGEVDIFVEQIRWDQQDPVVAAIRESAGAGRDCVLCTVVSGPATGARALIRDQGPGVGADSVLHLEQLDVAVDRALRRGAARVEQFGDREVLVEPLVSPAKLVIVGAVDTGSVLAKLARALGYQVLVVDPRERFLTPERFPEADRLIREWPQQALPKIALGPRDAAVCLTHDPKFDDPTLEHLLRGRIGYVGAIGSRTTQATRRDRLRAGGLSDEQLAKIHGPVGLDLGGASPAETALSILAEIVASRYGRSGGSRPAG